MQTIFKAVFLWVFIFSLAIFLLGCDGEEQAEGYKLYSAKCSSCHRLLDPREYPIEKFKEYIDKYGKELTPDEKNKILEFIGN